MSKIEYDINGFEIVDNRTYLETYDHQAIPCDGNYLNDLMTYLDNYTGHQIPEYDQLTTIESYLDLFDRCVGIEAYHLSNPYQYPSYLDSTTKITADQFIELNQRRNLKK